MKYKRISAFILCFAMITSTGCSLGKKDSSSSDISDYSYTSDSCEKYDLDNFSFELNKDFSVDEKGENLDGSIYNYDFKSKELKSLSISTTGYDKCTAEVSVQVLQDSIDSSKIDPSTDIETEKLDVPGFNAAAIHMTYIDDDNEYGKSYLYLTVEGSLFSVLVDNYKPEDRDKIKALFRDIASTVKYTGTDQHSTEQQFYDCDLFSFNCGPEWYIYDYKYDTTGEVRVELSYYYAQDIEHHESPSLKIHVWHDDEEDNLQKAADKNFKEHPARSLISEYERSNEEIFGYNAETVSFDLKGGLLNDRYKIYYFYENGYLYTIEERLNMRDEEGSKAELKDILDTVVIKKLSDEEIEKRKQAFETEYFPLYTFRGASFKLISELNLEGELDDSGNVVDFSGDSADLRISFKEDESDLERAAETDQVLLSGYGYENVNIKEVTVGNNTFKCISGVNSEEGRRAEDYLIIANGKLWEFKFGFDKETYEYYKYIAEKFLESLDLSNAE